MCMHHTRSTPKTAFAIFAVELDILGGKEFTQLRRIEETDSLEVI